MKNDIFLTNEQQVVCKLLSNTLFHQESILDKNIDWKKVYDISKKQAVVIPALLNINQYKIDEELRNEISTEVFKQINMAAQNYYYHSYLHELMTKNAIEYCTLKGVASSLYYPASMIRQMGDVDFIVKKEDVIKVGKILENDGFRCWHMNHECHEVYTKDNMHFELHFDFVGMPGKESEERFREILTDFFDTKEEVINDVCNFVVPNKFYHGLVMLMHTQKHLLVEGIGLRHLCDWAVFIQNTENFETIFKTKLKKAGLWKYATLLSLACVFAFDIPYQSWMSKNENTAKLLLNDIFDGGNFGRNNKQRIYEGVLIASLDRRSINHNRVVQLVRSLNYVTNHNWPISKNFPILLPIGWFYFSGRRFLRILLKKRDPIKLKQVYQESSERKELYEKIQLFEEEF